MTEKQLEEKSWASIFDDFVSNPPTASVFRLYLLSFLIWNESAILYLAFHNQSMYDKLKNFYEFIPFHSEWSLYFGPLIPFTIIFLIVFLPIIKVDNSRKSLYDIVFYLHQTNLKKRYAATTETLVIKSAQIDKQIEVATKNEKLIETEKIAETNERNQWLEEYESFKIRTALYSIFIELAKKINSNKISFFHNDNYTWTMDRENFKVETAVMRVFSEELELILIDQKTDYDSNHYLSLTKKGLYFFEQYINSLEH